VASTVSRRIYIKSPLDLSGSRDVIGYVTIRFSVGHFLLVVFWNGYPAVFEILCSKRIGRHDLIFRGHVTLSVISHVRFPIGHFLSWSVVLSRWKHARTTHMTQLWRMCIIGREREREQKLSIISSNRDIQWRMWRNGWHDLKRPLCKGQVINFGTNRVVHIRLPIGYQ